MTKLPQIKPRDIEKALVKSGFVARQGAGSQVIFTHEDGRRTIVPSHNRPVRTGTLRAILRQSDINTDDFLELIK